MAGDSVSHISRHPQTECHTRLYQLQNPRERAEDERGVGCEERRLVMIAIGHSTCAAARTVAHENIIRGVSHDKRLSRTGPHLLHEAQRHVRGWLRGEVVIVRHTCLKERGETARLHDKLERCLIARGAYAHTYATALQLAQCLDDSGVDCRAVKLLRREEPAVYADGVCGLVVGQGAKTLKGGI